MNLFTLEDKDDTRTTTTINVTEGQAPALERALASVVRLYARLESRHEIRMLPPLPTLDGCLLTIPSHRDVLAELLGRLERPEPDDNQRNPRGRAALTLATKIRAVTGFLGLAS
jgi:hypothetical protein